ncbi:MAG TPA: hypothetical protein VGG12_02970 [Methylovirgula sp.]
MNRFFAALLYGLAILFIAGLVHIVSILVMPRLAPHDAFARLTAIAKQKQPFLLPRPLPGQEVVPFEDPAVAQAVCMFDVSQAPFHVGANLEQGDALVTLSFRSRTGKVFYSMTDKASVHGKIDISVMTGAQLAAAQANDDEDNPPQELRLVAPQMQGFLVISSLATRATERAAAEARALSIECAPETLADE